MHTNKHSNNFDKSQDDDNPIEQCKEEPNTTGGEKCPHVKKGISLKKLKLAFKKNEFMKLECVTCIKKDGEKKISLSPWICLNCGKQFCGTNHENHAEGHFKTPTIDCHSLWVDSDKWSIWCFGCKCSVTSDSGKKLDETVEFLKKIIQQAQTKINPNATRGKIIKIIDKKSNVQNFPEVIGLKNLGNTCFLNVLLQCLVQTPFLMEVLQDLMTREVGEGNEEVLKLHQIENPMEKPKNDSITSVLWQTLKDMQSSKSKVITPYELLETIRHKKMPYVDQGQHDSHNFFQLLLAEIRREDLKNKCDKVNVDENNEAKVKFYEQQASSRLLGMDQVFRGELVCVKQCLECQNLSTETKVFLDLSLPIIMYRPRLPMKRKNDYEKTLILEETRNNMKTTNSKELEFSSNGKNETMQESGEISSFVETDRVSDLPSDISKLEVSAHRYNSKVNECSIQTCLDHFARLELMSGNNKVGCKVCTAKANKGEKGKMVSTESTVQHLIKSVPPVLILHLKRFQMGPLCTLKDSKHVSFPTLLDLSPVLQERDKKRIYALYGVVEHKGSISGGHFVTYVKSRLPLAENDPRWELLPKFKSVETNVSCSEKNLKVDVEIVASKIPETIEAPPGRWFSISDSMVREVDEKMVLGSQAYLLFYERIL